MNSQRYVSYLLRALSEKHPDQHTVFSINRAGLKWTVLYLVLNVRKDILRLYPDFVFVLSLFMVILCPSSIYVNSYSFCADYYSSLLIF